MHLLKFLHFFEHYSPAFEPNIADRRGIAVNHIFHVLHMLFDSPYFYSTSVDLFQSVEHYGLYLHLLHADL